MFSLTAAANDTSKPYPRWMGAEERRKFERRLKERKRKTKTAGEDDLVSVRPTGDNIWSHPRHARDPKGQNLGGPERKKWLKDIDKEDRGFAKKILKKY